MYNEVKLGLAFTIGLGVGILASKRFFQTKYEKIANEEIESVREKYSMRSGHIIETTSIDYPEDFEVKLGDTVNAPDELYSSEAIVETLHPEDDMPEEPFEINEEDFSETELGFEKVVLNYYVEDDILAEADSGKTDLGQTIGDEGLNTVRMGNCVEYFFRNPNYAVDYNVIRVPGSYYIE